LRVVLDELKVDLTAKLCQEKIVWRDFFEIWARFDSDHKSSDDTSFGWVICDVIIATAVAILYILYCNRL
jgi:hypothetical protein